MKILFWASGIIILYVYIGYPVIVYFLSCFYRQPVKKKYIYPFVSIILPVKNAEENIENKILSLLQADYPDKRFEILVGSDGSTDKTTEIAAKYAGGTLKLYQQEKSEGKPVMLNKLVSQARGQILVFTNTRHEFEKDFLKELVRNFEDEKVGFVSVDMFFGDAHHKNRPELGLYWKYERFIKKCESKIGSMLNGTDCAYAIRKELFTTLPEDLILDDVFLPIKIVQKGYRAIFEHKAKFHNRVNRSVEEEFSRKTRTLMGNFQLIYYLGYLFNPFKGKISWQFFSHKFLRLMVPFLMASLFVSNLFVIDIYSYKVFFILQCLFYVFAGMGAMYKKKNALFDVPHMFCVMNAAAVVGLFRFLTGRQKVTWEKVS